MVLLFPAAMRGNEAAEDILIVLVGCAITVFDAQKPKQAATQTPLSQHTEGGLR
jgi:hypothetical protein